VAKSGSGWSCWVATGVAVLFYLKVLSSHDWNPRAFILEAAPGVPVSKRGNVGYDGQYSYMRRSIR